MIVNGEVTGYFNSKLGLRQSCPLSPFLFSIVIDLLSCLLNKKVEVEKFTPLSHGPDFHISHLLFADDVLIFGKSNPSTTVSLRKSLDKLALYSGLCINDDNSSLCFSKQNNDTDTFYNLTSLLFGKFPFTFLGIPIMDGFLKSSYFNLLLDRIYKWLAGWKSKHFSLGGRLQLIRSTMNAYLSYWLRGLALLKCIIKKILSLEAKFFFYGNDENKIHMIAWDKTALPCSKGGVGILSINHLNAISKIKIL